MSYPCLRVVAFQGVELKSGPSPFRQTIFAVEKALVCGKLRAGDPFPPVRALSQACKINPNTAHKVIAELIRREISEVRPGIGTAVSLTEKTIATIEQNDFIQNYKFI